MKLMLLGVIAAALIVLVILVGMLVARVPADLNDDLDKGPMNVCVQNNGAPDCQSAQRSDNV